MGDEVLVDKIKRLFDHFHEDFFRVSAYHLAQEFLVLFLLMFSPIDHLAFDKTAWPQHPVFYAIPHFLAFDTMRAAGAEDLFQNRVKNDFLPSLLAANIMRFPMPYRNRAAVKDIACAHNHNK
jgi:hypothetical protein